MERKPTRFDKYSMVNASSLAKYYVEEALRRADNIRLDSDMVERLSLQECKACFYVMGRIGGAAVTTQPCACCGVNQSYGSTCTDALCLNCAKEYSLCKHCGGDLDMRERRRSWPTKKEGKNGTN